MEKCEDKIILYISNPKKNDMHENIIEEGG